MVCAPSWQFFMKGNTKAQARYLAGPSQLSMWRKISVRTAPSNFLDIILKAVHCFFGSRQLKPLLSQLHELLVFRPNDYGTNFQDWTTGQSLPCKYDPASLGEPEFSVTNHSWGSNSRNRHQKFPSDFPPQHDDRHLNSFRRAALPS